MSVAAKDIIPLSKARARFTKLCEEVSHGDREMIITKNGESCAALIDAGLLDHYHQLESAHIHLTLLEEAIEGIEDVRSGRTLSLKQLKKRYGR